MSRATYFYGGRPPDSEDRGGRTTGMKIDGSQETLGRISQLKAMRLSIPAVRYSRITTERKTHRSMCVQPLHRDIVMGIASLMRGSLTGVSGLWMDLAPDVEEVGSGSQRSPKFAACVAAISVPGYGGSSEQDELEPRMALKSGTIRRQTKHFLVHHAFTSSMFSGGNPLEGGIPGGEQVLRLEIVKVVVGSEDR
ncbi:hypothetical protein NMY22_g7524 [Coprinellus aureogranulatus]|nr:hypothetical protein NMY22_g7524 [Coprinellus aureogranulatus]